MSDDSLERVETQAKEILGFITAVDFFGMLRWVPKVLPYEVHVIE
jgi:hypothetical protein